MRRSQIRVARQLDQVFVGRPALLSRRHVLVQVGDGIVELP